MFRSIGIVFSLLLSQTTLAKVKVERDSTRFEDVFAETKAQIKTFGPDQVLVVVDLDNTVLHSRQILGGYVWFKWQEKMLMDPSAPQEGRVTDTLDELYYINALLYSYGSMELAHPEIPRFFSELQKQGVRVLCLTSRGPAYWEATIRDLQKNGVNLADPYWAIKEFAYSQNFFPEDVLKSRFAVTTEDIARFKLVAPVQFMLREGVFFTSGLHKGSMLDLLLKVKGASPKAIVFVDDSKGNVASMKDIYTNRDVELSIFRYSRYDDELANFDKKKASVIRLWDDWQAIVRSKDPRRLNDFVRKHFQ